MLFLQNSKWCSRSALFESNSSHILHRIKYVGLQSTIYIWQGIQHMQITSYNISSKHMIFLILLVIIYVISYIKEKQMNNPMNIMELLYGTKFVSMPWGLKTYVCIQYRPHGGSRLYDRRGSRSQLIGEILKFPKFCKSFIMWFSNFKLRWCCCP